MVNYTYFLIMAHILLVKAHPWIITLVSIIVIEAVLTTQKKNGN